MRSIRSRAVHGLALSGVVAVGAVAAATSASGATTHAPTLNASARVAGLPAVTYTHSIVLSGRATAGSRAVELQADPFPFKQGFRTVAERKTGRSGSYAFRVSPTHATRYRIRIGTGGATSRVLTVYVLEKELVSSCNLCSAPAGPGRHTLKVRVVVEAPPGPIGVKGPGYFYYGQLNGTATPTTLTLRKTVPLATSHHDELLSASYSVTFPTGPSSFAWGMCYRDAEAKDGYGLPGHHHCGDQTIRRGAYLG